MVRLVRIFRGEVERIGIPGYIGPSVRPQADSTRDIHLNPPEEGGIGKGRTGGGERGHENVAISAMDRLVRVFRGEVERPGISGDSRRAGRSHADSMPDIGSAPPEVGGIRKGRTGGGESAHKDVVSSAARYCLVGVFGGEVGRTGTPGDIGRSVRPQADSIPFI